MERLHMIMKHTAMMMDPGMPPMATTILIRANRNIMILTAEASTRPSGRCLSHRAVCHHGASPHHRLVFLVVFHLLGACRRAAFRRPGASPVASRHRGAFHRPGAFRGASRPRAACRRRGASRPVRHRASSKADRHGGCAHFHATNGSSKNA